MTTQQTPEEAALARLLKDVVPNTPRPVDMKVLRERRRSQQRRQAGLALAAVLVTGTVIAGGTLAALGGTHGNGATTNLPPAHQTGASPDGPRPSASSSPDGAQLAADLPNGFYSDGPNPSYSISVSRTADGFTGSIVFYYQDGNSQQLGQYTATLTGPTRFDLHPAHGTDLTGSFTKNSFTLDGCGSDLQFADPAQPGDRAESCTFDYLSPLSNG